MTRDEHKGKPVPIKKTDQLTTMQRINVYLKSTSDCNISVDRKTLENLLWLSQYGYDVGKEHEKLKIDLEYYKGAAKVWVICSLVMGCIFLLSTAMRLIG